MTTETTQPEPQPPVPRSPRRWRLPRPFGDDMVERSVARLLVAATSTAAAMVVAAELGALLSTFGLAGVVLAVAAALLVFGIVVRRQAMLPLALVAASFVLPSAVVALGHHRIDPSAGVLIVRPTDAADLTDGNVRRGVGSVLVDLRSMKVAPRQVITLRARSDTGHVVVALPRNRCYHLKVRSRRTPAPTRPGRWALRIAGIPPAEPAAVPADTFAAPNAPPQQGAPGMLVAFGRSTGGTRDASWTRTAPQANAPTLILDLQGSRAAVVRDYPEWVGPLQPFVGSQVGGEAWPLEVALPPNPGQLRSTDGWRPRWASDPVSQGVRKKWIDWETAVIVAAKQQAIRAAGACASREERAETWALAHYDARGTLRMIAANGLGTVSRWSLSAPDVAPRPSRATVLDRGER